MLRDEDFLDIVNVMSGMAKSVLSGEEVKTEKVVVEIDVWEPLVKVIEKIAGELKVNKEQVFQQLVKNSLIQHLQGGVEVIKDKAPLPTPTPEPQAETQDPLKNIGIDLSGLTAGLTQLQNIAGQLQGMQQMFEGVNIGHPNQQTNNTTKTKKDSE